MLQLTTRLYCFQTQSKYCTVIEPHTVYIAGQTIYTVSPHLLPCICVPKHHLVVLRYKYTWSRVYTVLHARTKTHVTVTNKHSHIHAHKSHTGQHVFWKGPNIRPLRTCVRGTFQIYVAPIQPILLLDASQQIESAPVYGRHIVVVVVQSKMAALSARPSQCTVMCCS